MKIICITTLLLVWCNNIVYGSQLTLVDGKKAKAVLVLGESPTVIEQHSADELVKYVKAMSGTELMIVKAGEIDRIKEKDIVLIGMTETNKKIKELSEKGLVKLSSEYPGLDGFIIKTVADEGRNYLILGGSMDRGSLYAVYHLLENTFKVGFFEDGDRIPVKETLIAGDIDIAERPYFQNRKWRCCINDNFMRYWLFEEWKVWLDWLAKKKFNIFFCHEGQEVVWKKLWRSYGLTRKEDPERVFKHISYGEPTEWDLYQEEFIKKVLAYGRSIGLRTVCPGWGGQVPPEFGKLHPEYRYMQVQWSQAEPEFHIHPEDPMFSEVLSKFIKMYMDIYGTDHIYEITVYNEAIFPKATKEEAKAIRVAFAKAALKGMRAVDSKAIWYMSGWSVTFPRWPDEDLKAFLDVLPYDAIYIADADAIPRPQYKNRDYFYEKQWAFGVMHALGPQTTLHGDLEGLINKVKAVAEDPKAKNCTYFYINPEIQYHNFLYYELAMKLAWNPAGVALDGFLKDYALLRYGEESSPEMVKCLEELAQSVYSTDDPVAPLYQYALGLYEEGYSKQRFSYIPRLGNALDYALKEKERLGKDPLYNRDLIDILRQYIGELFSYHLLELRKAFALGEKEVFEREAKLLLTYLESQAKLLSTSKDFCLIPEIERQLSRPGVGHERASWVKGFFTYGSLFSAGATWDQFPWGLDYMKQDRFELVKFYYLPRIRVYIDTLREKITKGSKQDATSGDVRLKYMEITKDFIEKPLVVKPEDKYQGATLQAVEEIFSHLRVKNEEFVEYAPAHQVYRETSPSIIAEDKLTDFWSATGGFGVGTLSAPVVSDVQEVKQSDTDSMKMVVKEDGSFRCWQLSHKFSPTVDWSDKDFLTFYWYGADTGGVIYLAIAAPDDNNYVCTTFIDDFKGWKQLVFPLEFLPAHAGVPDWKKVGSIQIRPQGDNLAGTWYIDRVAVDVAPGKKPKKVETEEKKSQEVPEWLTTTGYPPLKEAEEAPSEPKEQVEKTGEENGLVGLWHFDEGEGDKAFDSSKKDNHGEIKGARWIQGISNQALCFNGKDTYVRIPTQGFDYSKVTIEMWVKTDKWDDSSKNLYNMYGGKSGVSYIELNLYQNNLYWISQGVGEFVVIYDTSGVSKGTWHHLAATADFNSDSYKLFLDGVEVGSSTTASNTPIVPDAAYIGARYEKEVSDYFDGCIDEVGIYNCVLTLDEIRSHCKSLKKME